MKLRYTVLVLVLAAGGCARPTTPPAVAPDRISSTTAGLSPDARLERATSLYARGNPAAAEQEATALAAHLLFLEPSPPSLALLDRLVMLLEQIDVVLGLPA
jgi:hypothetical protein